MLIEIEILAKKKNSLYFHPHRLLITILIFNRLDHLLIMALIKKFRNCGIDTNFVEKLCFYKFL